MPIPRFLSFGPGQARAKAPWLLAALTVAVAWLAVLTVRAKKIRAGLVVDSGETVYGDLVDYSVAAVAIIRDGRIVYANQACRLLFRIPIRDVNCAFKVYRRQVLDGMLPRLRSTGALINVEMLARARKMGARVREVGVHHYPRETGRQTGGNPAVIVRAFRELLELWRELW